MASMFRIDPSAAMEGLKTMTELRHRQREMEMAEERHKTQLVLQVRQQEMREDQERHRRQVENEVRYEQHRLEQQKLKQADDRTIIDASIRARKEGLEPPGRGFGVLERFYGKHEDTSMLGPYSPKQETVLGAMEGGAFGIGALSPQEREMVPGLEGVARRRAGLPQMRPDMDLELQMAQARLQPTGMDWMAREEAQRETTRQRKALEAENALVRESGREENRLKVREWQTERDRLDRDMRTALEGSKNMRATAESRSRHAATAERLKSDKLRLLTGALKVVYPTDRYGYPSKPGPGAEVLMPFVDSLREELQGATTPAAAPDRPAAAAPPGLSPMGAEVLGVGGPVLSPALEARLPAVAQARGITVEAARAQALAELAARKK